MELVTERLVLREMTAEDWRALYEIERQPDVVRFMMQDVATEASIRAYPTSGRHVLPREPRVKRASG